MGQVIQGDCLDILPTLEAKSVQMVFTDPPYGHTEHGSLQQRREAALGWQDGRDIYRDPKHGSKLFENDGLEANELVQAAFKEFARVLVPGGVCCCCGGGGGPDPQFARWSLWLDEALDFKQMVVWDKGPMGMGWHYRRSYETVLVAQKGAKCNWYDESHKVENIIRHIRKIIPSREQHPTEKPVELVAWFIRLHTKPGDLVLDPFMGSGSTGVAALSLGRRFLGIEIDLHWCKVARKRIAEEEAQPALKGLPSESVNCVATNPPYFAKRKHGCPTIYGGDADCLF